MLTGPVGPVEVLFYWPEDILGIFYWSGASGSLLASSPDFIKSVRLLYAACEHLWVNKEICLKFSSGSMILLIITFEF